uniref:Regulatory protein zeste n=1 Tax=Romanomermis culicivorax TaxID=13658 RepID=A0A915K9G8_ROMCU
MPPLNKRGPRINAAPYLFGKMSCQKFVKANDRMCEKIWFLKAIEEQRDIIFGAFSVKLTNNDKENTWKEVQKETLAQGFSKYSEKAWSKLWDEYWQDHRKATLRKFDKNKQSGSSGES